MQNLAAQVTSSLLHFPDVTIKALEEDEINLDSVLRGKFTTGRTGLAWLACGPQLEVTNAVTGERLSAYRFSGVAERPPTVVAVKEFSWQKKTGLLVGLVEAEGSVLCLYDVGISRVVKAVVLPGSVTAVEPIINHGGASASTQHLHQSLRWFFGVAAVVTDVGHVLLIDLCLDDVSNNQDELDASDLEVMSGIPNEIPKLREAATRERRHLCLQLLAPSGTTVSSLTYISRINLLAVGFSDGYLSLWNMKSLRRQYHVQIEGGRVPVCAVTFQEPENDPRNCCYLWAVQSGQSGGDVSLHLLQLAFGDRKCLASGQILYEVLEYCEERYSLDLSGNGLSLRGKTNNTKLLGCQTIEKFRAHGEREDGVMEVTSPDTSVAIFSWQVNTYGQGKPTVYMGVFDINRWYQAQMPDSLRPGQFLRNCSYFAFWSLEAVVNMTAQDSIFDILVHERSLSRGVPPSYPPPEQFYYPSTYNFDATCLLCSGLLHITCAGFQKETLQFLKTSAPSLNEAIPDGYNRCLVAGLLSPRLADVQPSSLSQEEQLQAVLSAAVETSSLGLLTSCIKQWTSEEQPRSATNLRFVLEWTWNKVVFTKQEFDRLCVPLYDGSCNFIDPQTLQFLQHCHLRFSNLTTVLNCFLTEAQELTKQGLIDLSNKHSVTKLLTLYASVVLWFCRSGLLPDTSDETMQLSKPYYNYQLMQHYYGDRRKKLDSLSRGKWNTNSLMIDGMICQFGDRIEQQWSRHGGTGKYPPASMHALLEIYLLENADEMSKHTITIYFLLDIMYSFPDKPDSSIESFPTAFSVPFGLVKLIQGFWLLDHNDYQNSVDCILHPAASREMAWQHNQVIETLMCQGDHRQALRYIQVMKPPLSTSKEVKLHITVLLANRYVVEAWKLQRLHINRVNVEELLKHMYETCQEMGLMEDLLKFTFTNMEQEYLHRFLQTSGGVQNQELLLVHHLQRANYIPALQLNQSLKANHMNDCDRRLRERTVVRNSIMDQYGKILPRVQRTLANERAKPYSLSSLVWREVSRPKPLSTMAKKAAAGNVITKANFISNVLSKIREVSVANEKEFSPYKSLDIEEASPINIPRQDIDVPDAFFGTPISNSKRISRLLDSVVHPVLVEPSPVTPSSSEPNLQTPRKPSPLIVTSSPVQSSLRKLVQLRGTAKAAEFNLLETPLVVRKAKALAASTSSSGFTGFTPQSILRPSVRATPLASPSASPGRSVTPPLRPKETKISFMEEISNKWTKGVLSADQDQSVASPVLKSAPDTLWTGSKVKIPSFSNNTPSKENKEIDEFTLGIQDESPGKMEVGKDASNVSIRSDQTTLEFHDAPTPEDLEEELNMSAKPQHAVFIEPVDNEMDEDENIQPLSEILQPADSGEFEEVKYIPVRENGPEVLDPLIPVKDIDLELELELVKDDLELEPLKGTDLEQGPVDESNTSSFGTEEPGSESSVPDSESVISIHDSDDIVSLRSETVVEDAAEELNEVVEVEVMDGNLLAQEEPFADTPFSHSVEVKIVEEDKGDIQEVEYISKTAKLECNIDHIEQPYIGELADIRDSEEPETDDTEGEHFVDQNNFSLVLEGDGDDEVEVNQSKNDQSSTLYTPPKVYTVTETVEKCSHKPHDKLDVNSFSPVSTDQRDKIMETLPYVPEPIKVTIKENLLDAIKDTINKDVTADVSESIYENTHVRKLRNSHTSKSPLKRAKRTSSETVNAESVCVLVTPPKKPDEQNIGDIKVPQISPKEDKSSMVLPLTPRRSVRKSSKLNESIKVEAEENQLPTTPRRGSRKAKESKNETISNALSVVQEEQLSSSTVRISRKTRNTTLEEPKVPAADEPSEEEMLPKQPSTPTRTRRGKASVSEEPKESDSNPNVAAPLTPTRITRSRNVVEAFEKIASSQEDETNENDHLIVTPTRGRRSKRVVNELVKQFELNSSQPAKVENSPPVSPKKMSLRRTINKTENQANNTFAEENLKVREEIVDTPRKKSRRTTLQKTETLENTDTFNVAPLEPAEELVNTRSAVKQANTLNTRQTRKNALSSVSEDSAEERLHSPEENEKTPSPEGHKAGVPKSTRVTRARASNLVSSVTESALENNSFVFSIPTPRRKKKAKDEIQLPSHVVELEPQTPSQFVFSPPVTRTRRATRSITHETLKERDFKPQEIEDVKETEELPVKKPKGRPLKSKAKKEVKSTEKTSSSPPPVEIQLLSPPESPGDVATTKTTSSELKISEKNPLRRNRRRIINISKPVTRRNFR
ncbi:protein ELYS isoform X2 [Bombina bombina]|uniref:protein ELYS isoform X2 n=1 Tax=Bombina bombina TaxID=8345 RepID=UPI00235A9005|nr:protein ELYS isoform X2 [Bombina bombina]